MRSADLVDQVLTIYPLSTAMPELVPSSSSCPEDVRILLASGEAGPVMSGLWLLVDELDLSHTISQGFSNATGSWWHAIMHRREGDFWNSKYWYHRAAGHPAFGSLPFDADQFVDEVEMKHRTNPEELLEMQRAEWELLIQISVKEEAS